jgi:GNAT superfamily N-acetyltransferase
MVDKPDPTVHAAPATGATGAAGDELPVRAASHHDTAEILRLAALMYDALGMGPVGEDWGNAARSHLAVRLGSDAAVFVADDPRCPGRLVAIGAGSITRRLPGPRNIEATAGYIQWVATDPAWRRHGLATRITQALLDWFKENGVRAVELHAAPAGEQIYRSLGFQEGPNPGLRLRF